MNYGVLGGKKNVGRVETQKRLTNGCKRPQESWNWGKERNNVTGSSQRVAARQWSLRGKFHGGKKKAGWPDQGMVPVKANVRGGERSTVIQQHKI